ncbi:MAG: SUMF1/EgtB/PvdO family nonheme iron enzyme [Phycisphaeraceae bacterium]|nr:SUMF1/EgtB/PvdO family nonheme iron enzyme [Phycisphaeraceae bacterium]
MKKYALLVGVSDYDDPDITNLSFAARDAEDVGRALASCGFDQVTTLVSGGPREPNHVNVVDALHRLAPLLSGEDLFLFYFAGHGIETPAGAHLLTANSRARMPELASLSTRILSDCLSRIECADRVLILDACRNDPRQGMGDQDNLMTAAFSRDIAAVAETVVEGAVPTTWVLFACRPGQRAYEWPDAGHGAFSHYLLEGLRGEAADDTGRITVQALGRYVEHHVQRWAKKAGTPKPQTPWGEHKGSWRDICLAEVAAPSARTPAEPTPPPRPATVLVDPVLHVRTVPAGALLSIDGRAAGSAPIDLTLPAGNYRLRAEMDGYLPWQRQIRFDATGDAQLRIELLIDPARIEAAASVATQPATTAQQPEQARLKTPAHLPTSLKIKCGIWVAMKLTLIPSGAFVMGAGEDDAEASLSERPAHRVTLTSPFYMGIYPVTQAQYRAVTGKSPSHFPGRSNPVERVSWYDAQEFCAAISARTGRSVRLLTEAEWEYACRAGTTASRYGNLNAIGWFDGNSGNTTHPVGAKRANAWGLYDMIGNVWEWCEDNWHDDYEGTPSDGSAWTGGDTARVVRGGSWGHYPQSCRSSRRYRDVPDYCSNYIGFRVVVDLE